MPRQGQFPPRCPFQGNPFSRPSDGTTSQPGSVASDNLCRRYHHRSSSQSFIPEEQPAWFNDLLNESDFKADGNCLRRSASDSATFLNNILKSPSSVISNGDEENHVGSCETFHGLQSACVYGPNSPREIGNSPFLGNAIVSAFSEYATQDPLLTSEGSIRSSRVMDSNLKGNVCTSSVRINTNTKPVKRCEHFTKDGSTSQPGSIASDNLNRRHHRSSSQSFITEEQPAWLDDLLNEPDSKVEGNLLRRSASDSATFLDNMLKPPLSVMSNDNEENHISSFETFHGLESVCVYGPNSPRQRENSPISENAIVSAFSEYATQDPFLTSEGSTGSSGVLNSIGNACTSSLELNTDIKPVKRHPGQRSRVRKLQYIAELEQKVDFLQNLESDLATRVTAILQQRTALSIENGKLKQQLIRLQQQELVMEGEYRSLKREAERLKMGLANPPMSMVKRYFGVNPATAAAGSKAYWHVPDIGKLSLN